MRKLIGIVAMGIAAAAQEPKPKPEAPPAKAVLSEVEHLRVENIQLRLQLASAETSKLNKELESVFARACASIGGSTLNDCVPLGPTQAEARYSVQRKPATTAEVRK